ncbi:dTMP kinase [Luteococcus peritonei]|uniref:Thymidylate kinase n=1 Tax=Luteococcus peritonei TaxID=88874 RepID=A0ABW4RV66_9ACTN
MTESAGLFVVFEGGDSAGKSTQVRQLARWLAAEQLPHRLTHEPGDSWLGQHIRTLVLDPESGDISARAECLLYIADKAQHVVEVVRPALARGEVVVSDRYVDSTIAYQAAGRNLPPDDVETIARWATQSLRPHLTVLLDVDPRQAVNRIAAKDRIEAAGEDFHRRVREGFLALAAADPEHYLVLPARDSVDSIARRVRERVSQLLEQRAGGDATEMSEPSGTLEP